MGAQGVVPITYTNINDIEAEVILCDANGNVTNYDWMTAQINTDNNLSYNVNENTGEARTAFLKVAVGSVYSDLVTISQLKKEEPAQLPFSFDDGKGEIQNTIGLTSNGLGTNYSSSPYLKFDTTGDWLLLYFKECPGPLSFDIEGNTFSGGTFKVQTSEDGVNFADLAIYTETELGSLSPTIDNLGENVRFIKWIYTNKVNGNVALGNIRLEKSASAPSIIVDSDEIQVNSELNDGTLAISYENLTITDMDDFDIQYYDVEGEEISEPDWLEVLVAEQDPQVGEGYVVSYLVNANEGEARTAYFKVYSGDVYSNLVTITQAAYVAPPTGDEYALFTGELVEGDYVIYYEGKAMNNVVDNSDRLKYVEVFPNNDAIITDDATIVWHIAPSGNYWTIYSADAQAYAAGTGAKNKAQMLADGTDDKALWTVSGTETYEFVNKANAAANVNANLRNNGTYGFACYATSTGGALSLYKKVESVEPETATIAINSACNDGTYYYGTYYIDKAYDMPEGLTGQAVSVDTDGTLVVEDAYTEGTTVPANTALLIKAATAGDYTITLLNEGGSASNVTNQLKGTLTADEVTVGEGEGLFYRLTMHEGAIGFWWGAENGGSFAPGANKAYLFVPTNGQSVRQGFDMGGDANGISDLLRSMDNDQRYYNLQGQRVMQPTKGLYIVNGKKMIKQ